MIKLNIQEAIERAKLNPNGDFAKQLRELIESGQLDTAAAKQGVDLSIFGRPTIQETTAQITGVTPRQQEVAAEQREDLEQIGTGIVQRFEERQQKRTEAEEAMERGEQTFGRTLGQQIGQDVAFAGDVIGEVFKGGVKLLTPERTEEKIRQAMQDFGVKLTSTQPIQGLLERYEQLKVDNPPLARDIDAALGVTNFALEMIGLAELGALARTAKRLIPKKLPKPINTFDDLVDVTETQLKQVDDIPQEGTTEEIRRAAEEAAPDLTFREKMIGLSPAMKKRIEGNPDGMIDYFNIAHARNSSDEVLTPYGFGSKRVDDTEAILQQMLNSAGNRIGQTRAKLATTEISKDAVDTIENSFRNELRKLNLDIKNGEIVQKGGTVSKLGSRSDLNALNELYNELLVFKQAPTFENAVNLRMLFDNRIKWAKSAQEVSNSVDPVSKSVRSTIKDVMNKHAGDIPAQDVAEYADLVDALGSLQSYTNRRAGGEYLLRLVLSGRGREAQKIISTIKKHTGVDLMDDATFMFIATETVGDLTQQTLFRRQLTQAGYDVERLIRGDVKGILGAYVIREVFDAEDILMEAARRAGGDR